MHLLNAFFYFHSSSRSSLFLFEHWFLHFFLKEDFWIKTSAKGLLVCSYISFCFLDKYKMPAKTKTKCLVNDAWLSESRFSEWLKRTHNSWQGYCSFCQKSFDISNSLTSHASWKKHSEIQVSQNSNTGEASFDKLNTGKAQSNNKYLASKENLKSQRTVESILVPVNTLRADVLWTLKVASSHFSLRSCLGLNKLVLEHVYR